MKMLILVCVLCAVVAGQEEIWVEGDMEGSLFSITYSDLLDMGKEDMIQVAAILRLGESISWHQGDPNEYKSLLQHMVKKLIPEKYKPKKQPATDYIKFDPNDFICSDPNTTYTFSLESQSIVTKLEVNWIGSPQICNYDGYWLNEGCVINYQIGLREDGVVVWRLTP